MSRKLRTPKPQIGDLPSPAWTYWLLTGTNAPCRVRGWVAQAHGEARQCGEPDADQIVSQHEAALLDEAAAHHFQPFFVTHRRPTGAAFNAWSARFLAAHTY